MEYRNRRRRRRGGVGRAAVAVIMIGAIVYLISASAAGTWVAKNVMAPVFSAVDGWLDGGGELLSAQTQEQSADSGTNEAITVSLSTGGSAESIDVTLPAISCYALQMGAFSVQDNALAQAETLKALGAAGYVLQDGDRYRVLASGYSDSASAQSVRERLTSEGTDCTVYELITPSAAFRVTAEDNQLTSVSAGFGALAAAYESVTAEAVSFDGTDAGVASAQERLYVIRTTLTADAGALMGYSGDSPVVARMLACYDAFCGELDSLIEDSSQSGIAFSSKLKYTQLYITDEYAQLMEALT